LYFILGAVISAFAPLLMALDRTGKPADVAKENWAPPLAVLFAARSAGVSQEQPLKATVKRVRIGNIRRKNPEGVAENLNITKYSCKEGQQRPAISLQGGEFFGELRFSLMLFETDAAWSLFYRFIE
jgi:hypothetical protein